MSPASCPSRSVRSGCRRGRDGTKWGPSAAPTPRCYFVLGVLGDGVVGGVVGAGLGVGVAVGGVVDGDADGGRSPGRSPRRSVRDSEHAAANVVTSASRQNPESSFFIRSFL